MTKLQGATERLFRLERGMDLGAFVQLERAKGTGWRPLAQEVRDATGVDVAVQTLLNWYGELVAA